MKAHKLIISIINSILPVKKKTILFKSYSGQYSDSPKAISEYIHEKYPEIHLIWAKSSSNNNEFPKYAEVIDIDSEKYHKYEWRANVIVDNVVSVRSGWIRDNENLVKKTILKYYTRKKEKQLSISTWHGAPLKRIGMDSIIFKEDCYLSTNCNYILSGNDYCKKCLQSSLGNAIPVVMSGIPKNDYLINNDNNVFKIKEKLGIPIDKKVILYAPTFRQNVKNSGVMQMQSMDFKALFRELHLKFGGDWCFVFRTHMHVTEEIKKTGFLQGLGDLVIDGNIHEDMADYLMCTDVLLTDYSSSMFDFLFTKRPCLLYTPDLEYYEKSERGFYLDIYKLPFPIADSMPNLIDRIKNLDLNDYHIQCGEFLHYIGNIEDGKATMRVAEGIASFLNGEISINDFMKYVQV